ncbi:MAG: hypothetical protein ACI3V2_00090 [Faecousia sp.]
MPVHTVSDLFSASPFFLPLLLLCAVLLSLSIPAYYYAIRPRRGTTEWIKRLEPTHFTPLRIHSPGWTDIAWALLTAVCAAALRFAYYFFSLKLHRKSNAMQLLSSYMPHLARLVLLSVFSALALYLLLRTMFGGKQLPALLCAILAGFTQNTAVASTALLFASVLCLYAWMSAPYDAPLFFHAFWLLASGLLYALALLLCGRAAWLAPWYLGAYIVTQVLRWRGGNREQRIKKLGASLMLTLLAFLFATLLLWLLYCLLSHRIEGSPMELLRSFRFYREMLPTFGKKLASLFRGGSLLRRVRLEDGFVFLAGLASLIPLLHGTLKLRDTRCLLILCLLPFCLCAWLLGGAYLLPIPLLLSLGRLWQTYTERGHSAYAVGFFCAVCLCFLAKLILI